MDYLEIGGAIGRLESGVILPTIIGLYFGYLFLSWMVKTRKKNKIKD